MDPHHLFSPQYFPYEGELKTQKCVAGHRLRDLESVFCGIPTWKLGAANGSGSGLPHTINPVPGTICSPLHLYSCREYTAKTLSFKLQQPSHVGKGREGDRRDLEVLGSYTFHKT